MKKIISLILTATAVIAAAISCQKIEKFVIPAEGNNVYEITVGASFGQPETRALSEEGNVLSATFATAENIYAYNVTTGTMLDGHLNPLSDGASTTLTGTLTGTINNGDNLKLIYLKSAIDYSSQDGTLPGLAAGFDGRSILVGILHTEGLLLAARCGITGGRLEDTDPDHITGSAAFRGSCITAGILRRSCSRAA